MFYEQLIEACKIKQTAVSKMTQDLGLSLGNVNRWKKGGVPSVEVLDKIADYLDVTTDYLLGRTDSKNLDANTPGIAELSRDEVLDLLNPANQSTVVINIQNKGGENKAFEMDADEFAELMQLIELRKAMFRKELDK